MFKIKMQGLVITNSYYKTKKDILIWSICSFSCKIYFIVKIYPIILLLRFQNFSTFIIQISQIFDFRINNYKKIKKFIKYLLFYLFFMYFYSIFIIFFISTISDSYQNISFSKIL